MVCFLPPERCRHLYVSIIDARRGFSMHGGRVELRKVRVKRKRPDLARGEVNGRCSSPPQNCTHHDNTGRRLRL
jgi:hypothetical protein